MAAAVLTRPSTDTSLSHLNMSSPKDSKRNLNGKSEEPLKIESDEKAAVNAATATTNAQPLAPPPKPNQNGLSDTPDYFNQAHGGGTQFNLEPNPFEQSFGNSSSETPGKSILPPVASITSPSPLQGVTPGWSSLRSGPLSPAMLTGPQNTDYFSDNFRGGFPTPNESSLRTGLTPGGGGSMFPAPSPNSTAIFNLQSGGATPSTLDFHRTALSANQKFTIPTTQPTSQPEQQPPTTTQMDRSSFTTAPTTQPQSQERRDLFNGQDVNSAANDLLQFATQSNGAARNGQFAVPNNQANQVNTNVANNMPPSTDTSPTTRRGTKSSIATSVSMETGDQSESGHSEQAKPSARNNRKKSNATKTGNNRRKADETPARGSAKKAKGNAGQAVQMPEEDDSDEQVSPEPDNDIGPNGKKMTDEEKRKNFLERNRVAALKCRQRKKQWLANLQQKVELFGTENDALSAQVTQLREEVVNLKTLLLAHKDCPVSQAQGLGGQLMSSFIGEVNQHANPYGLSMHPNSAMAMMQPGHMPRT